MPEFDAPLATTRLRVRFAELSGDHVYYGHVLRYFEAGLLEALAQLGLDAAGLAAAKLQPVTAEIFARYRRALGADRQLAVETSLAAAAPKRALFACRLREESAGPPAVEGRLAMVFLGGRPPEPAPLPPALAAAAGERRDRVSALDGEPRLAGAAAAAESWPAPGRATALRVRFGETDAQGWAYFANFLTWFEVGRSEFLRQAGLDPLAWVGAGRLPVVAAWCRYLAPARFPEELEVRTAALAAGPARLAFLSRVLGPAGVLAVGFTIHAHAEAGAPRPLPPELREALGTAP